MFGHAYLVDGKWLKHTYSRITYNEERIMRMLNFSVIAMAAGLLVAAPAFAQTTAAEKQRTDGNSPTMTGPGSGASKQRTDGEGGLTVTGPGSGATKQR